MKFQVNLSDSVCKSDIFLEHVYLPCDLCHLGIERETYMLLSRVLFSIVSRKQDKAVQEDWDGWRNMLKAECHRAVFEKHG